jgi:hypothetical protein
MRIGRSVSGGDNRGSGNVDAVWLRWDGYLEGRRMIFRYRNCKDSIRRRKKLLCTPMVKLKLAFWLIDVSD